MAGVLRVFASRLECPTPYAVDSVHPAADLECTRPHKRAKLDKGVGPSSLGLGPQSAHGESAQAFKYMQLDAGAGPPLGVSTGGIEAMLSDGDLTLLGQVYWQLSNMQLAARTQPDACMTPSDVGALVLLALTNAGPSRPILCNCDGTAPTRFQLVMMLLTAKQELFKMHTHVCAQGATDAQLEIIITAIAQITAVVGRLVPTSSTPGPASSGGERATAEGGSIDTEVHNKSSKQCGSLAPLCTDAGTPAPASEQWVQTKDKVMAKTAKELSTVSRRGGGAPIKASTKVLHVPWREGDLARWTLTATIELKMQVLEQFIAQLPPDSKSSEGQVHPYLRVSAVCIPVPQLSELEAKLRKVYPRTTSASPLSKSTEKTKWLTKFFCSIGMMHDKSHPLSNVKRLKFDPEVWNQTGYRLIRGGCDGGGKPRIQYLHP
jgi:hypothetical protein